MWKKITFEKTAGVRVLHDAKSDMATLYCSTTDRAFGPVIYGNDSHYDAIDAGDAAEKFAQWHHENYGDPRDASGDELESRFGEFSDKFHGYTPSESSDGTERCSHCDRDEDHHVGDHVEKMKRATPERIKAHMAEHGYSEESIEHTGYSNTGYERWALLSHPLDDSHQAGEVDEAHQGNSAQ